MTGQILIEIESVIFCTSAWALPASQPDSSSITVTPAHAATHKCKYGPCSVPLNVTASTGQQTSTTEAVVGPSRVFVSSLSIGPTSLVVFQTGWTLPRPWGTLVYWNCIAIYTHCEQLFTSHCKWQHNCVQVAAKVVAGKVCWNSVTHHTPRSHGRESLEIRKGSNNLNGAGPHWLLWAMAMDWGWWWQAGNVHSLVVVAWARMRLGWDSCATHDIIKTNSNVPYKPYILSMAVIRRYKQYKTILFTILSS